MKKLLIASLVSLSFVGAVQANTYATLSIGMADISLTDEDDNSMSYGGAIGYDFSDYFGMELTYLKYDGEEVGGFDVSLHSIGVNVKGQYPMSEEASLFLKAGYANLAVDITSGFTNYGSEDISKPVFGAGFAYKVTDSTSVALEYSSQQTEGDAINNIGLGVTFNF